MGEDSNMADGTRGAGQANPAVDPTAAIDFLRALFAGTRDMVELRALPSRRRIFTRQPSEIRRFIEAVARENVFFGVATREGGGDKSHCQEISVLWVDVDFEQPLSRKHANCWKSSRCPRPSLSGAGADCICTGCLPRRAMRKIPGYSRFCEDWYASWAATRGQQKSRESCVCPEH